MKDQPQVVVSVGTDFHPFDRIINWIDAWALAHPDVSILVQRGTSKTPSACPSEKLVPHAELLDAFAKADVVVSHGGPSTVMDARMVGRLPIVVARNPAFGEHVDGHQMRFAEHLDRHGLAEVVDSKTQLFEVLTSALADPASFTVPVDGSSIAGVVGFGRVLDQLLETDTAIETKEGFEV